MWVRGYAFNISLIWVLDWLLDMCLARDMVEQHAAVASSARELASTWASQAAASAADRTSSCT